MHHYQLPKLIVRSRSWEEVVVCKKMAKIVYYTLAIAWAVGRLGCRWPCTGPRGRDGRVAQCLAGLGCMSRRPNGQLAELSLGGEGQVGVRCGCNGRGRSSLSGLGRSVFADRAVRSSGTRPKAGCRALSLSGHPSWPSRPVGCMAMAAAWPSYGWAIRPCRAGVAHLVQTRAGP